MSTLNDLLKSVSGIQLFEINQQIRPRRHECGAARRPPGVGAPVDGADPCEGLGDLRRAVEVVQEGGGPVATHGVEVCLRSVQGLIGIHSPSIQVNERGEV